MQADEIGLQHRRSRHSGESASVRAMEPQFAGSVALDAEALFVDSAAMTPAQQHRIGERSRSAIGQCTM